MNNCVPSLLPPLPIQQIVLVVPCASAPLAARRPAASVAALDAKGTVEPAANELEGSVHVAGAKKDY